MWYRLWLFVAFAMVHSAAFAQEKPSLADLFDGVCIASQLNEADLKSSTAAFAAHFDMKIMDAPSEPLSVLNPDAKYGWVLGGNGQAFMVFFATKPVDWGLSHSCNVGSPDGTLNDVRKFVESRFQVKKINEMFQGSNKIIIYKAMLLGFPDGIYVSIQEKDASVTDDRFVSVSLYEGFQPEGKP